MNAVVASRWDRLRSQSGHLTSRNEFLSLLLVNEPIIPQQPPTASHLHRNHRPNCQYTLRSHPLPQRPSVGILTELSDNLGVWELWIQLSTLVRQALAC